MADKSIEEMSDEAIESELSNISLNIGKKMPLIKELSARYADKIVGNSKPDTYFRNPENSKIDMPAVKQTKLSNQFILVIGTLLMTAVCLGGCTLLLIVILNSN